MGPVVFLEVSYPWKTFQHETSFQSVNALLSYTEEAPPSSLAMGGKTPVPLWVNAACSLMVAMAKVGAQDSWGSTDH